MNIIRQNQTAEWSFTSSKPYRDPFNEIELSVHFRHGDGEEKLVPAFWVGGKNWRVRFASPRVGSYHFQTICSDPSDSGLHGQEGDFKVARYTGSNPLFRHGPIQVAADKRHFEHADGTPFFWLGDTWWMGLCKRMTWPKGFQTLTRDRVKKGFTVVQIVAGLYPDMPAFDERGANEAGYPWEKDYGRIKPAYFDMADRRIQRLVESGLVPCIVGCWGYFLPWIGVDKMKKHWRNLVARYGASPVVWCLAGEGTMPYYLSETNEQDRAFQKKGWTELGAYLRQIDPYHHPVTIHPSDSARNTVENPAVLDFDMLQTGHRDRQSVPNTITRVVESYNREPRMPVINGEVCYEGIGEACRQEVQRFMFWACVLNGAAGHTYGANGIWQVNTRLKPFGPSPHGMSWGNTPWEDAYQLPGSAHLGLAKRLLERYEWWRFEPHPEWIEPHWSKENYFAPYAAGIPGEVRVIFIPLGWGAPGVKGIEKGIDYRAFLFNPTNGNEQDRGPVVPDANGDWALSVGKGTWRLLPIYQDWVLVLKREKEA